MAQGEFTREEAEHAMKCSEEILQALPKSKKMAYFGHFNLLFLAAAKQAAPDKATPPKKTERVKK